MGPCAGGLCKTVTIFLCLCTAWVSLSSTTTTCPFSLVILSNLALCQPSHWSTCIRWILSWDYKYENPFPIHDSEFILYKHVTSIIYMTCSFKISPCLNSYKFFFICRTLGGCLDDHSFCYTLEVSFYSFQANCNPASTAIPYTEEACILFIALRQFVSVRINQFIWNTNATLSYIFASKQTECDRCAPKLRR